MLLLVAAVLTHLVLYGSVLYSNHVTYVALCSLPWTSYISLKFMLRPKSLMYGDW